MKIRQRLAAVVVVLATALSVAAPVPARASQGPGVPWYASGARCEYLPLVFCITWGELTHCFLLQNCRSQPAYRRE